MTPTWYDLLGVERDATPDQIKAAWRAATDAFEPGTGGSRFRMFNEAADVLLDPEKRRAYDASLGDESAAAPVADPATDPATDPVTDLVTTPAPTPATTAAPVAAPGPPDADEAPAPRSRTRAVLGAFTSTLGLAILGVLTALTLVLTVFLAVDLDNRVDDAVSSGDFDLADGTAAASVAERAVAAVLAYDYRNMEAGRDRALTFLTPKYQETYTKIFDGLIAGTEEVPGGAIETKAVVNAEVLATAVVDAEKEKVEVLVFVDQQPIKNGKQQPLLANRVVATMVLRDGTWLLDALDPLSAGF